MNFDHVGVVGAGGIGGGVAQCLAQANMRVVLVDVSCEILDAARVSIDNNIRRLALIDEKVRKASRSDLLSRIEFTLDYDRLREVDFVVENCTENWEIKKNVYPRLDKVCRRDCILAANTSAISITRLAATTQREDRVLGMHFMNPVPQKSHVEVIKGKHTSEDTLLKATEFLTRLEKKPIVVQDFPGFVSNRVMMLAINEAIFVVQDEVATPTQVDEIFVQCFAHRMGPLATADLIGLDTVLRTLEVLYESFNDSKFLPCPLLRQMVESGLNGRKSGKGFFNYFS